MDFADLTAFVCVAELTSFSRAAEHLHLTQPAVSKRVAALESELDTRLFDRIGRQVTLTATGYRRLIEGDHAVDHEHAAGMGKQRRELITG